MLVFLRPALRCVPLRFLPREPFVVEFFFVAANPAGAMPSSNVNARKLERLVFLHSQGPPAVTVRSKITMEFPI